MNIRKELSKLFNEITSNITLKSIITQPSTHVSGDKYYNSTTNLIYEYKRYGSNYSWGTGIIPNLGTIYTFDGSNYIWDGEEGLIKLKPIIDYVKGFNYVMVYGIGTPTENAAELQATYNVAKTMPRYLGEFNGGQDVESIDAFKGQTYSISNTGYIFDENQISGNQVNSSEITLLKAKSVRTTVIVAPGEYEFTTPFAVNASGIDVVSLTGNADVKIINYLSVNASNVLIKGLNCPDGIHPGDTYSGIVFDTCIGNNGSFDEKVDFPIYCVDCIGGLNSFGNEFNDFIGTLENCKLTTGTLPTPTGAGKIYNCIDGNGDLVNYPAIGGVTLEGTNYVFVQGKGTPTENAAELQATYNVAKTMPRYLGEFDAGSTTPIQFYKGQTLKLVGPNVYTILAVDKFATPAQAYSVSILSEQAKSVRTTVIVAPGEYEFTTPFVVNVSSIDIVSLTGNADVKIINYLNVNASNVLIKGLNCPDGIHPGNTYSGIVFDTCIGNNGSFDEQADFPIYCVDCIGGLNSFGNEFNDFIGTLENCKLTTGTLPTPTGAGKIYNCIDGNGDLVNYPAIGGVTLEGTNYVFVQGKGTPTENAAELQAAYDVAKTMPRYLGEFDAGSTTPIQFYKGQTLKLVGPNVYTILAVDKFATPAQAYSVSILSEQAKSVRTTVIVAPGDYTFGTTFIVDTESIDIVSLTENVDIILNGINVTANNVYLKGLNCGTERFDIPENAGLLVIENCEGGNNSYGDGLNVTSTFIDTKGGSSSFGARFEGKAIRCYSGNGSFGSSDGFYGIAEHCTFSDNIGSRIIGATAKIMWCKIINGNWSNYTPSTGGHISFCINGDGSAAANV